MKKKLVLRKEIKQMLENIFMIGFITFVAMFGLVLTIEIFIRFM